MLTHRRYYQEFVTLLAGLARRHSVERVFTDFLVLAMCAYHPSNFPEPGRNPDPENEAAYLEIANRYPRKELDLLAKLLALLRLHATHHPYTDLLGEYFQEHITRGHNGQFFTPQPICEMMARVNGVADDMEGKRVNDCACGSGRMLLAFAEVAPKNLFYASDIDANCARMTALNFFLNGMVGEVVCMNTLTLEARSAWHVNAGAWGIRPIPLEEAYQVPRRSVPEALAARALPARREEPAFVPRVPPIPAIAPEAGQLRLF